MTAAQGCVVRNCNGSAGCEAARKSFDDAAKADNGMRQIEADSKRNQDLAKHKKETEAVKSIEQASKEVNKTQGPS